MSKYIIDDIKISTDSDEENTDEEYEKIFFYKSDR